MTRLIQKAGLTKVAIALLAGSSFAPLAKAGDRDHIDFHAGPAGLSVNIGIFGDHDRSPRPAPWHDEQRVERVWVEPVYRTVCDRAWVEPQYRTVCDQVWREPVTRDVCERVWVEATYEDRPVVRDTRHGRVVEHERVRVAPAHWEDRHHLVVVSDGHYETIERQELVSAGHWQDVQRQEVVAPGHWEERVARVDVPSWRDPRRPFDRG